MSTDDFKMGDHLNFALDREARTVTLLGREYSLRQFFHTAIILFAYVLLRPYLLKLSGKFQARDHDREIDFGDNEDSMAAGGKVAPGNAGYESDGEDQGWGAKARRRARAERQRIAELSQEVDEHEDAELEALLED